MSFFFSSRRRHTRYIGDWSSDVCSSDLDCFSCERFAFHFGPVTPEDAVGFAHFGYFAHPIQHGAVLYVALSQFRSEERRVGKECRSRCPRELLRKRWSIELTGVSAYINL